MIEIKNLLKQYGIEPNKIMGQNFLIDKNVLKKIIETADIKSDDTILEIGPGLGTLTLELAKRAKQVIAIEKDKELCTVLAKILKEQKINNVEIINDDILKYETKITKYKIIANIPYYLTSPLIRKFLEAQNKPDEIILMIQKEVAERICAQPPKMSLLSVAVQFYSEPEIIFPVSKNSFYPIPKVDSAVIKITPHVGHRMSYIDTEKKFFKLVKMGFSAKRKMLKNNLSTLLKINNVNLEKLGLNPNVRAENLTINDWIKLYTELNCIDA